MFYHFIIFIGYTFIQCLLFYELCFSINYIYTTLIPHLLTSFPKHLNNTTHLTILMSSLRVQKNFETFFSNTLETEISLDKLVEKERNEINKEHNKNNSIKVNDNTQSKIIKQNSTAHYFTQTTSRNKIIIEENELYTTHHITSSKKLKLEILENRAMIVTLIIEENVSFHLDFFLHSNAVLFLSCILKKSSSCIINGNYISRKENTWINIELLHQEENSKSNLNVLGYTTQSSQTICDGLVQIGKNAPQSSGFQTLKNVVLSNTSKVFSEPQLEIYNPNVECSHSSTISPVEKEVLYYMQTRGITQDEGVQLLEESLYESFIQN